MRKHQLSCSDISDIATIVSLNKYAVLSSKKEQETGFWRDIKHVHARTMLFREIAASRSRYHFTENPNVRVHEYSHT